LEAKVFLSSPNNGLRVEKEGLFEELCLGIMVKSSHWVTYAFSTPYHT
jgi:hypothetical protein